MKYIIAIDFDNTIVKTPEYPHFTEPIHETVNFIRELQKHANFNWCLWTCRTGKELQDAVKYCEKLLLFPDYINSNSMERVIKFGGESIKISCDCYIDDKNFGGLKVPDPETFFDEFEKEQQRKENKK